MNWVDLELVLVALAAMLSPLTLTWSVLALVLSKRPLFTGLWFYLGAIVATLAVGVAAAFVLGNAAASHSKSTPKTWVAVIDVVGGILLLIWVVRFLRRPVNPEKEAAMMDKMTQGRVVACGRDLRRRRPARKPGRVHPVRSQRHLRDQTPAETQYVLEWIAFALVSLLPLTVAIVMLLVARDWTDHFLGLARDWLDRHARVIAAVIVILLAASLLRNGIAGLTS